MPGLMKRSNSLAILKTKYTTMMLATIAAKMFMSSYSELSDHNADIEPAPTIKGKTTGVNVASLGKS